MHTIRTHEAFQKMTMPYYPSKDMRTAANTPRRNDMPDNDEPVGKYSTPITAHHTPLTREQIEDLLRMLADAFKAEDEDAERNAATADGIQDDAAREQTD
jgi:hypothetical protein